MPSTDYLQALEQAEAQRKAAVAGCTVQEFDTTFAEALQQALTNHLIIVAPYTQEHPEHVAALHELGLPVTRVPCPDEDDYWRLLKVTTSTTRTVIVIEHDIVPPPQAIGVLINCPQMWCGYKHSISFGRRKPCLGLAKLSLGTLNIFDTFKSRHWSTLDIQLEEEMRKLGLEIHEHLPEVCHVNPLHPLEGIEGPPKSDTDIMLKNLFMAKQRGL